MYQVGSVIRFHGVEDVPGRVNVITLELGEVVAANLRLQHYHCIGTGQMIFPIATISEVGILHHDIRVHLAQDFQIATVLVEYDQI